MCHETILHSHESPCRVGWPGFVAADAEELDQDGQEMVVVVAAATESGVGS